MKIMILTFFSVNNFHFFLSLSLNKTKPNQNYFSVSLPLSLYIPFSLSVFLTVSLSHYLTLCQFIYLSIALSFSLSFYSLHPSDVGLVKTLQAIWHIFSCLSFFFWTWQCLKVSLGNFLAARLSSNSNFSFLFFSWWKSVFFFVWVGI